MEITNYFQNDSSDEQNDIEKIAIIQKLYSIKKKFNNYIYFFRKELYRCNIGLNDLFYILNTGKNISNLIQKSINIYENIKKKIKLKICYMERFMKKNNLNESLSNKIKCQCENFEYIDQKFTPIFVEKFEILIQFTQFLEKIIQSNELKKIIDFILTIKDTFNEMNENEIVNENDNDNENEILNYNNNENENDYENENKNINENENENFKENQKENEKENENENKNDISLSKEIDIKNENHEINEIVFLRKKRKKKNKKKVSKKIFKKKKNNIDFLSKLKKKYPESDYIQKLSKTIFNHNQLEQTILYECFIDYSQNRIKKSIIKCITNKNLYKYLKLEFEINCQSKEKDIIDYFKNIFTDGYFYLRKSENKFELSGKINDFSILYPKYFQNLSFIKFLGIITIRKYIYQFYEELAHEYQNPNIITDNVRIEMNDEIISLLNNNYNILIFLRDYYNTKCNK